MRSWNNFNSMQRLVPHIKHIFLPSILLLGDKKAVLVISILISLSATLVNCSHFFLFALFDWTPCLCAIILVVEVRFSCFSLRNTTKGKLPPTETHQSQINSVEFTNSSVTAEDAFHGVEVKKEDMGPGRWGCAGGGEKVIELDSSVVKTVCLHLCCRQPVC